MSHPEHMIGPKTDAENGATVGEGMERRVDDLERRMAALEKAVEGMTMALRAAAGAVMTVESQAPLPRPPAARPVLHRSA